MNINEVLANRANQILGHPMGKKTPVHPNDHVNKCQSSNDVIPSAMHISTLHLLNGKLFLSLEKLINALDQKIKEFEGVVKVGRTHLQDAVPIPLTLEFEVYKKQMITNKQRLKNAFDEICNIAIGGTALGTGINAHPEFAELVAKNLTEITGIPIKLNPVKAEGIASHSAIAYVSSNLKLLALSLMKMANDIRWMGSGPRAGLAELNLPPNEPGSSIMPGKINPTQSEALIQVCLQVIGNDSIISAGEAFGSILDLNVCKPIIIYNLLESIEILSGGMHSFIDKCLIDLSVNEEQIKSHLENMIMIVTNLNPYIGYDKTSEIAQKAFKEGKSIKQVIIEMGIEIEGDLDEILDPKKMV
jgi:fumarate hydratase class II